nr:BREX-1 system adenine-specific DNA-methyltransferase PglX [Prolixibacteraceae bacterium]
LVTGFELLFKMYREQGYNARQAVDSILKNNIYGLDIDDRAMQLARFAVLLKAAQYDADILNRGVIPNIYSFPEATLADSFKEEYYSKEQADWNELMGMKLKAPITIGKKEYKVGTVLDDIIIDKLINECNEPILVDYSADLEGFWGTDKKGFYYSEFFYAIQLLQQGKNLGSAMKLSLSSETLNHIEQQYKNWNEKAEKLQLNAFDKLLWDNLKPHLDVLFVLTRKYTSVVANPPYMGRKSMNPYLSEYIQTHYPRTKWDLMTVFMEVIPNLTGDKSRFALINLPSWLFLTSFNEIRELYINNYSIDSLLHMGRGIFGIDFGSVAFAIKKTSNIDAIGNYFRLHERNFQHIYYEDIEKLFLYSKNNETYKYDFSQYRTDKGITEIPRQGSKMGLKLLYPNILQNIFSKIPGSPIAFWLGENIIKSFDNNVIGEEFCSKAGIVSGNDSLLLKLWFEISRRKISLNETQYKRDEEIIWVPINKGGTYVKYYGNYEYVINIWDLWTEGKTTKSVRRGDKDFYYKTAITWSMVAANTTAFRYSKNKTFNVAAPAIFHEDENKLKIALGFLNSNIAKIILPAINPTINVLTGDIESLPFVLDNNYESLIINKVDELIQYSKKYWNYSETSWEFEKSPLLNQLKSLFEAFCYWSKQATEDFFQLHANEEALNRIFINIYGLNEELSPEVALKDITILQDELDRKRLEELEPKFREKGKDAIELPIYKDEVLSQFVSYGIGVFLGRYRLDKSGFNIAHPNPTEEETASYKYNGHAIEIDEDGILPLMGEDCAFPDDALVRVKDLILAIWGEDTLTENLNFLQDCLGMDLHKWLTEKFWSYHTGMYKKKPIYWLFSSDVKKPQNAAFKVLVYMHRMDKYTVQKIQRNYLHPHQEYIEREIKKLEENEENLAKQEQKRLKQLNDWKLECRDYNEVLKELANQQIEFNLDDGVSVNYAKFEGAVAKI